MDRFYMVLLFYLTIQWHPMALSTKDAPKGVAASRLVTCEVVHGANGRCFQMKKK